MTANDNQPANSHGPAGYEKEDVNIAKIVAVGLVIVIVIVIFLVALNEYFVAVKEDLVHQSVLSKESASLRDLRAREDETLNSYKLLDAEKKIYSIPINRAIELVADEAYRSSQRR